MVTAIAQFGETSSSGLGALGFDGKAFAIQLITFILVFLVLKKWAFKPIAAMLDQRRKTIDAGVALGEQMKKDQAALEAKVSGALATARKEADHIIAGAQETSRQVIRDAEDKARIKAAGIVKAADQRIITDTATARRKLESELVGLISDATEAIIGEKVDATKDAALIDRALKGQA